MNSTGRNIFFILLACILFYSCTEEKPVDVDYSFTAAVNVEKSVEDFNQVQFDTFEDLNLGFFKGSLWIKLEIENPKSQPLSCMFICNDRFNRNYTFYKLDTSAQTAQLVNLIKDPLKQDHRTYNNPIPNLKIDLEANERATYLITTCSDGRTKDATPSIIALDSYHSLISEVTFMNILFYAIIFCLLLINLYQWNIYRQKIFLYYLFYILSTVLVYLGIEGYLYNIRINKLLIEHIIFVSVKLWALSLILYTSKFLETEAVAPKFYKLIKTILVVVLGGILIYQFAFYKTSIQHLHYFENVLSVLWLLIIIGMIAFSAKTRWLELKYYLIPLTCFVAFTVFGIVNVHFQLLAGNSFTYVKIGAIIELIGFTYFMTALIRRKLNQSEKLEQSLAKKEELLVKKSKKTDLVSIFNLIENSLSSEEEWDEFKSKLKEVDPTFLNQLLENHSELSKSEIRLLTLIRIGYSQKEIASILNIAPDSVKKARNRVRKKLNLEETDDLNTYLRSF